MFIVFIKSFLYLIDILKYSFVILFFISDMLIVLIMIVLRFFLEKVLIIVLINFLKYDIFV